MPGIGVIRSPAAGNCKPRGGTPTTSGAARVYAPTRLVIARDDGYTALGGGDARSLGCDREEVSDPLGPPVRIVRHREGPRPQRCGHRRAPGAAHAVLNGICKPPPQA